MSFLRKIQHWFVGPRGRRGTPYIVLLKEISILRKKIFPRLLKDLESLNDPQGKYGLREDLEKSRAIIDDFSLRIQKLTEREKDIAYTPETTKFIPDARIVIAHFSEITKRLRKDELGEKDINFIVGRLTDSYDILTKLDKICKKLVEDITNQLPFERESAKDSFGATEITYDDISVSTIIKLAKGFGFDVRPASKHTYAIDLRDGIPCAVGESTGWRDQVRTRMANATGRSNKEIEALLRIVA